MHHDEAVIRLFALAHPGRLNAFRTIIAAGHEGLAAGKIAQSLGIAANTASTHLSILTGAGLLRAYRDGRSIIYSADFDQVAALIGYIVRDCCQGDPHLCASIRQTLEQSLSLTSGNR